MIEHLTIILFHIHPLHNIAAIAGQQDKEALASILQVCNADCHFGSVNT